jgi:hypothetical protein
MGERRGAYRVLVENLRERPRCRWEDIIQLDLQEVGLGSIDWIELAQDRNRLRALVKAVIKILVS